MKTLVASLICLLIGYQIGRWLPQSQNIALTNKTEALEEQLKGGGAGGGASNMNILDTVLAAPRGGDITEVTSNTVKQAVLTTNETIVVTQFVEVVRIETNVIDSAADRRERWEKMSMEERMDQAQGMWEVRMDLARSGFFKKMKKAGLELNHKKRRDFQLIMDTMNYHMKTTIDNWVQTNGEKDKLYPDDGIGLMTDAMNVIKLNYGQMDAKMPEGWRDAAGDDFRLFDFIDPSVGGSLLQMENQLKPLNGRPQDRQGPHFDQRLASTMVIMTIVVSALTVVLIFFYSFTHKIPKKPAARITSVTTIPMDSAFTISDSKGTTVLITPRSNFVGGNNESDYIQYEWKYYRKLMHRLLLVESGQTETRYDRIGFFDPSGRNKLSIEWSSRGIDAIWIYPEPSINVNTNPTSLVEHGAHP